MVASMNHDGPGLAAKLAQLLRPETYGPAARRAAMTRLSCLIQRPRVVGDDGVHEGGRCPAERVHATGLACRQLIQPCAFTRNSRKMCGLDSRVRTTCVMNITSGTSPICPQRFCFTGMRPDSR